MSKLGSKRDYPISHGCLSTLRQHDVNTDAYTSQQKLNTGEGRKPKTGGQGSFFLLCEASKAAKKQQHGLLSKKRKVVNRKEADEEENLEPEGT